MNESSSVKASVTVQIDEQDFELLPHSVLPSFNLFREKIAKEMADIGNVRITIITDYAAPSWRLERDE